jgi:hypothetical protein
MIMDNEQAKDEVSRLLETDKGEALSPKEVREILKKAKRKYIFIEKQNSTVNEAVELEFREIDWQNFLELLRRKLPEQ